MDLIRQTPLLLLRSVFDEVAQHLPLREVHILGLLHRTLRHHPASHVELSLIHYLAKYTSSPLALREQMRQLGCVISGSAALHFIARDDSWTPDDMDLYCPNHTAEKMCNYLEGHGYVLNDTGPWVPPDYPGLEHCVSRVLKYHRERDKVLPVEVSEGAFNIDIIVSRDRSALTPITFYHSTAVMNFISADRVTCMYPSTTFKKLSVQQHGTLSVRTGWFSKYTQRGYKHLRTTGHLPEGVSCGSLCPYIKRTTLDQRCLHIFLTQGQVLNHNWHETKWTLVAPPLDTVHCWNPSCANNDALSIITALKSFMSSARDCLLTDRDSATASVQDGRQMSETLLPTVVGYNGSPGYRLDFYSLEHQVSTFTRQIQIVMESEWALQHCSILLKDIIGCIHHPRAKERHQRMGFFNHALFTLNDNSWLSKKFRDNHKTLLTKFDADQESLQKKNSKLLTIVARFLPALAAIRARDTHGYSLSRTWPSITKIQADLVSSISSLRHHMAIHPPQSSPIQLQTCLKLISEELYSTSSFLNDLVDRQMHLFRDVQKLHSSSGLVQDEWDASKRLHLIALRRDAGVDILPEEIKNEQIDEEIRMDLSQIGQEIVESITDLWNMVHPDGAEPDTDIWIDIN